MGTCRLAGGKRLPHLNRSVSHHLSHYLLGGNLRSAIPNWLRSLSRSDGCFDRVQQQAALSRSGLHSHGGIEQYQDGLSEGAFGIQRPIDNFASNKDTLLCLRSSCSCGLSLSSGLAALIGGGGL